jgi:hypothetical protein
MKAKDVWRRGFYPVAIRPLCGASNRKASGSAGGYLLQLLPKTDGAGSITKYAEEHEISA